MVAIEENLKDQFVYKGATEMAKRSVKCVLQTKGGRLPVSFFKHSFFCWSTHDRHINEVSCC